MRHSPQLLADLISLLHGEALVDVVWYPRTGRAAARLNDGRQVIYDSIGRELGAFSIGTEPGRRIDVGAPTL